MTSEKKYRVFAAAAKANFENAVKYFNNQDWKNLPTTFDPNVVLYSISGHILEAQTAAGVTDYLKAHEAGANFQPDVDPHANPPQPYYQPSAGNPLTVSGTAVWTHSYGGQENVQYQFQFNQSSGLINSLWCS